MTCPNCDEHCAIDSPCICECHDQEDETLVSVVENQSIEYEQDEHLPDGMVIKKLRIVVSGPTTRSAYYQFKRVHDEIKA